MLTINRRDSIPGLVRGKDNSRSAEGLSHAEAPTHWQQSVSLFTQLILGWYASVELWSTREVAKHERSVRVSRRDATPASGVLQTYYNTLPTKTRNPFGAALSVSALCKAGFIL